jgi:hypothetical protein
MNIVVALPPNIRAALDISRALLGKGEEGRVTPALFVRREVFTLLPSPFTLPDI